MSYKYNEKSDCKSSSSHGVDVGFCGLLTIAFIVLKLCGVISWSWVWVLAPLWIGAIVGVLILVIAVVIMIVKGKGIVKMTIKEIEKKIAEQENALQELKNELKKAKENKNKIPDDVKDIPLWFSDDEVPICNYYDKSDGGIETYYQYYMIDEDGSGADDEFSNKQGWIESDVQEKRRIFLDWDYAKDFRDKTQLIADCNYFKFRYDHDYKPDWSNCYEVKYYVYYDRVNQWYCWGENREEDCYEDLGVTYFSTAEIAEKCANWLNYLYKKGKYAESDN